METRLFATDIYRRYAEENIFIIFRQLQTPLRLYEVVANAKTKFACSERQVKWILEYLVKNKMIRKTPKGEYALPLQ